MTVASQPAKSSSLAAEREPRQALNDVLPYPLLVPSLVMVLAVMVYPLLYSARISGYSFRFGKEQEFILFGNYADILKSATFWSSLLTTVEFTFFAVSIEFLLGLGLALLLNGEMKYRAFFRTALIIPMIVMPVVVGIVWRL